VLRFILVLICLVTTQSVSAATILVLGDSLSAAYGLRVEDGWVALLQKEHPEHTWINASITGETTQGGLSRLDSLLIKHEPDVLILELGANDGLRGLPLNLAQDNLQTMVSRGKSAGADILILGIRIPPNYGPRYTHDFATMFTSLAEKNNVAVVPFFLKAIAEDSARFQPDRLHPNASAQPLIAETVWPDLQAVLESLPSNKH
jgi:acyl-CoA thioesterase-1